MGIGDYIPARGEARVLAELKGSYGKKGRMARFRRGGYRGRRMPYQRTYWQTPVGPSDPLDWVNLPSQAGNGIIASFQPTDLSALGSTDLEDTVGRLLRFDGSIFCRMSNQGLLFPVSALDKAVLFYWWKLTKLSANSTLDVPGDEEFSPVVNFAQTLRRKDVIKWGCIPLYTDIPWVNYQLAGGVTDTIQSVPGFTGDMKRPWSRIPFPRLPRGGMRLSTYTNVLVCYGRVYSTSWQTPYFSNDEFVPQYVPFYRTLWAKA